MAGFGSRRSIMAILVISGSVLLGVGLGAPVASGQETGKAVPGGRGAPQWPPTLLANGGFEQADGNAPRGWKLTGSGGYSTTQAHEGTRSLELTGPSGAWAADAMPSGPVGAYRAISGWFKVPRPALQVNDAHLNVSWRGADGAEISADAGANVSGTCLELYYAWAGDWCFNYSVVAVPAGARTVVLSVVAGRTTVSAWNIDDVTFGPTVSTPEALGPALHLPQPVPAPGTAAVDVDARDRLRSLPRFLFGDNALHDGMTIDDKAINDTVRTTSNPGVLRFPGGDKSRDYDWEHPTGVDVDGLMRYLRLTGTDHAMWTMKIYGKVPALTVQYTGNAVSGVLSVGSTSLDVKLDGTQTDGSKDLRVDFATHGTVNAVIAAVNAAPGYSATLVAAERGGDRVLDELVPVKSADARAATNVELDTGNVHKAERLVDYANNPNSTVKGPSGKTRDETLKAQGLPIGPYNIRYIEIGNENYIHPTGTDGMTPVGVANRVAAFAKAIRQADPDIQIGVPVASLVHDNATCCGSAGAHFVFNMVQAQIAGPYIDFVIDHPYENFHNTHGGMLSFPEHLRRINLTRMQQELFARYSPDHRPRIDVAYTEFDLLTYATFVPSGVVSPNYQLVNGLVVADELGAMATQGAAVTARWDQFSYPFGSHTVLERGGGNPTRVAVEPAGHGLTMFNQHFGDTLVRSDYRSPTFAVPFEDVGRSTIAPGGSGEALPLQTSYASLSEDGTRLFVMLINKSGTDTLVPTDADAPLKTKITLKGFRPAATATVWTFNGKSRGAYSTVSITAGANLGYDADAFGIARTTIADASTDFDYTTPAHSITVIEFTRANGADAPRGVGVLPATGGDAPIVALVMLALGLSGLAVRRQAWTARRISAHGRDSTHSPRDLVAVADRTQRR